MPRILHALSLSLVFALGMAAATLYPATITASAQAQLSSHHQVELTPIMVEGFLATYPAIEALGEEFRREYGYADADPEDPAGFALAYARHAEARARMEAVLRSHDIGSLEEWAQVTYSLMIAYSFAESGENISGMDEEMADAIAQIRRDPSIPEAQREQLAASLEAQIEQIRRMRPSAGNIALAAQYADRIRSVVDHFEDE